MSHKCFLGSDLTLMQRHSDRGAVRSTSRSEARDSRRAQQPGPVVSAEDKSVQVQESVHGHYELSIQTKRGQRCVQSSKSGGEKHLCVLSPPRARKSKEIMKTLLLNFFDLLVRNTLPHVSC